MSILITGTAETLQVVLDAAPATNQLPCTASYADQGALGGDNTVNTNGTTAVTLVAAPASGIARVINGIAIPNRDTATRIVTVNKVVGSTSYQLVKVTLLTGYQLYYENTGGWRVLDGSGNFVEAVTVTGGTLTANQGTAAAIANAWPMEITDGTSVLGTSAHPIRIDPTGTTTQPVSGTINTTPPANATTNVTQFGGVNLLTGTGASGTGIPRVTVSNDSTHPVSQSGTWSVALSAGSNAIGSVTVTSIPAIPAGSNAIGSVSVSNFPASQAVSQSGTWNTYNATFVISSTMQLTTTTASAFGASTSFTKFRFCKVDLFNYTNSSACTLTIKDGSGAQINQIQIPAFSSNTTLFGIWFSDLLNSAMNNTTAGASIQLSTAPSAGSVGVQIGWSN